MPLAPVRSRAAGASAPEHLVEQLIAFLQAQGYGAVEEIEIKEEDVRFSLPPELGLTQIQGHASV